MYQSTTTTSPVSSSPSAMADRGQLLLKYYDSTLTHMDEAAAQIRAQNPSSAQESLYLAASLVAELVRALDHTQAPELCANLESLYLSVVDNLVLANDNADTAPIDAASSVMRHLRSAWAQIV